MRNLLLLSGFSIAFALAGPALVGKPGAHFSGSTFGIRHSHFPLADSVHSYDVRQYRDDINLTMTDRSYSAHEFLSFASRVPSLAACSLDFVNLVCDSVRRAGAAQAFDTAGGQLTVTLSPPVAQNDSIILDIFYRRLSTAPELGYYFAAPPAVSHAYGMTCTPPRDARYWLACYDEPLDKAERGVELNLTVPDTFQACANGRCDSVTVDSVHHTRTWWWRHPHAIATYLITFAASRFATWSDTFVSARGDTTPLVYFVWPEDSATSRTTFAGIPGMLAYYTDSSRFGRYPFERYGMVPGYYGFPWGGMENQTMTMINTQWLYQGDNEGMAHELSHSWWGDMVTCVDFRNVWLNEGFATYWECMYMGHAAGRSVFRSLMTSIAQNAISQDRARRFPIYNPADPDIYNYGTIYCKGGWVEHMLRYVEGDTAWEHPGIFFRALRAYGDSFRYGTASTDDYCRINEHVTGLDLAWFFDEWVYQAGYPHYALNWRREAAGDSWRVVTTLSQNNGNLAPPVFHMPLPVRLNCQGESVMVTIRPDTSPYVDTFTVAARPLGVTVDPDNWVLDTTAVTTAVEEMPKGQVAMTDRGATIVRGVLTVPASCVMRDASCVLLDVSGRTVRSFTLHSSPLTLDLTGLAPGVYFLRAGSGIASRLVLVR